MCGIAGVVSRNGRPPVDPERFDRAVDSMRSRGPDDRGTVYNARTALGARRLSIIDIASGAQPIASEDGCVCVVLNGELYSYQELQHQLARAGHRFKTRSDTEVLVHGYEEWGIEGLLERLNGMFAFALHDVPNDRVYIARDRLGIKPVLYSDTRDAFCFASSITALLDLGCDSTEPDPVGVRLYLHNQYAAAPHTVLAGIRKLPPASYLCIDGGIAGAPKSYWRIPAHGNGHDERDWPERVRELLTDAVRSHMVADVEVGLFLSGGLDSSILLSLMTNGHGARIRAFSVAVDGGPAYDETPLARDCAQRFGAEFLPCRFASSDLVDVVPRALASMEEPIGDAACLPTYILSEHASRFVKVAMSGEGADELFAGYGYYGRFTTPHGRARHRFDSHRRAITDALALDSGRDIGRRVSRSRLSGYPHSLPASVCDRLLPDMPSSADTYAIERGLDRRRLRHPHAHQLNTALAADIDSWLPDNLLAKVDRMSMAHSLEVRVPFLDHRVVEMAFRMPTALKRQGSNGKLILKQAFGSSVGVDIVNRPKHGFNLPLGEWFRGSLRPLITDWITRSWDGVPWLDRRIAQRLVRDHDRGVADYSRQIWLLFVLTSWFEQAGGRR